MENKKENRSFYSCPEPVYASQRHPMREERGLLQKAWLFMKKWRMVGAGGAEWDALVDEMHKIFRTPYLDCERPLKKLALGLEIAVCEYLEALAFDSRIPSRAALMKRRDEELKRTLENLRREDGTLAREDD